MGETCINVHFEGFFLCVCVCSYLLRKSEAGSWPKLKGMTVTFGQNQEQSVFCLHCFHFSLLSVLASLIFPSSLHHFLSFALHNKGARKKKKIEHQPIFFHLLSLSCGSKLPSIENSSGAYCAACGLNRLKQGTFPGVIKKSRQYRSWNISAKLCFHWKTCSSLKNYIIYPDLNLLVRATDGWMLSCPLFSFFSLLSAIISSLFNFSYLRFSLLPG